MSCVSEVSGVSVKREVCHVYVNEASGVSCVSEKSGVS